MNIINITDKARWCHDYLLAPGEIKELNGAGYEQALRLSPEIFQEVIKKTKVNKRK